MSENLSIMEDVALAGLASWDAAPFFQKVTDVVPNIIYVFNQETLSNEFSNRSLALSLGYSAQEVQEMGPQFLPKLCHPADLPRIGTHFSAIKSLDDGEVLRVQYRMRHRLGYWAWLLSYDTVFDRDAQGNVVRHIGVASDITAQKTAEERALSEQLKAETTNEELREFAYSISHDIRAPSNTLSLILTELLETHGSSLDPDAATLVDMALQTVTHMGQLVDDVLHYTRVVSQEVVEEHVDLNAVLRDVIDDLDALIRSKNAIVVTEDLPTVRADGPQIRVLLKNLVENAVKFQAPGKQPHVRVTSSDDTDEQEFAITVHDNGIGIDEDKHEQIFTIFKRLNTETKYSGTGLGLAICRRIATNHGSKICLDSRLGVGSSFTIGFPPA